MAAKAEPQKTRVVSAWKHASPLISCRFDPTGRFVFAGAEDHNVVRWDVASGKATVLSGHESWVRGISFSNDGATMVTADYAGRLLWWEAMAEQPKPQRTIDAHEGWARGVDVHRERDLIATVGNDHLVKLWSLESGKPLGVLAGHECHVYCVLFHPDGKSIVSADLKGVVCHWEIDSGKLVRKLDASAIYKYDKGFRADCGGVRSMAFRADGAQLACAGISNVTNAFAGVGNPMVVRFDWKSGKVLRKHRQSAKPRGVAWGVAFHSQDFFVAASGGGGGGFLLFWKDEKPGEKDEARKGDEFFQLKLPNTARDLSMHADGLRLATAHHDRHLRISIMQPKPA
jgi:WD40 repeat protein